MGKILTAKEVIGKSTKILKQRCAKLIEQGNIPRLKVILVGKSEASLLYISNKKRMCERIGAQFELLHLDEEIQEQEFLAHIEQMNNDSAITGCFVQLPVPQHLKHIDVTQLINPLKDVDGFHSRNIMSLYNHTKGLVSCTPKGIVKLLNFYNIPLKGKHIVLIGRGFIVGRPLSLLLQNLGATLTICHSFTQNIEQHTQQADIIVCALGVKQFLKKHHLNLDKKQYVIDVGINFDENKKLFGDVDFEQVLPHVEGITPVPGGIGPMTVYSLIENLLEATQLQEKI